MDIFSESMDSDSKDTDQDPDSQMDEQWYVTLFAFLKLSCLDAFEEVY